MFDPQTESHLTFDELDVQANRSGRISPKQKARLLDASRSLDRGMQYTGLALLATGVLGFVGIALMEKSMVGGIVCLVLFASMGAYNFVTLKTDRFTQTLRRATGQITLIKRGASRFLSDGRHAYYFVYELHIDDLCFTVDPSLVDVMRQGGIYNVYYAEGWEIGILSAEPVAQEN